MQLEAGEIEAVLPVALIAGFLLIGVVSVAAALKVLARR